MRHRDSCECDACYNNRLPYWEQEEIQKRKSEESRERQLKIKKAQALFDFLEIPYHKSIIVDQDHMSVLDLYDILMDEEKLRVLVSKLRNKAFW